MTNPGGRSLPPDLAESLATSFFIRFTTEGRHTGLPRTTETTFVWDGASSVVISGYPGKRDWIANMTANPNLTLHTVERGVYYDIPGYATVVTEREKRTVPLLAFLSRWAAHPSFQARLFRALIRAIRVNRRLHLPWWGPFWVVRKILDRMPCAVVTFTGPPSKRDTPPPQPARQT